MKMSKLAGNGLQRGYGRQDLPTAAGLEGLKQLLRSFEWLMERLMPQAKAHLEVRIPSQAISSPQASDT